MGLIPGTQRKNVVIFIKTDFFWKDACTCIEIQVKAKLRGSLRARSPSVVDEQWLTLIRQIILKCPSYRHRHIYCICMYVFCQCLDTHLSVFVPRSLQFIFRGPLDQHCCLSLFPSITLPLPNGFLTWLVQSEGCSHHFWCSTSN